MGRLPIAKIGDRPDNAIALLVEFIGGMTGEQLRHAKRMQKLERGNESRRSFVKKLFYVPPAIATLTVLPAFAMSGSGRRGSDPKHGSNPKHGSGPKYGSGPNNGNGGNHLQQLLQNRRRGWS